ncbi:TPA: hypothetical protein ACODKL_004623, partial [Salmonella enterica subsp. salamae serovar 21:z10:z6]
MKPITEKLKKFNFSSIMLQNSQYITITLAGRMLYMPALLRTGFYAFHTEDSDMVTSYSDMTLRTVLTTQDTSWGRPHLSENRIDEIQMKARMQQRHYTLFPDTGDVSIVSFKGKEYTIKFLRDGDNSYFYKVNRLEPGKYCCPWVSQFFSGQVSRTLERQLNERHITPLSSTWFPATPLVGFLSNQGMHSLARQVQADPHDGLKNLLHPPKKMQPSEPSPRIPPAVPPKPRVVAVENPPTLQPAAALQPIAASGSPSPRNPPAVPLKPRVVAAENPPTLQPAAALQPIAASGSPSPRIPPALPPKPHSVAAENPPTLQPAAALQPIAASGTPSPQ